MIVHICPKCHCIRARTAESTAEDGMSSLVTYTCIICKDKLQVTEKTERCNIKEYVGKEDKI